MPVAPGTTNDRLIESLKAFYENFSADNLDRLEEFYTQDIEFVDPIHKVDGVLSLRQYLKKMSVNLLHYRIHYIEVLVGENSAYLTWEMEFANKHIRGGQVISVRGMSHLKFTNRIYYHEDSYDLGALLYDHLPLLGSITRSLKGRMSAPGG